MTMIGVDHCQPVLVANIDEFGTRLFMPGAKAYVLPQCWGDGGQRLRVICRHRRSRRWIISIVASKRLANWRMANVGKPIVVELISAIDGHWPNEQSILDAIEAYSTISPSQGEQ